MKIKMISRFLSLTLLIILVASIQSISQTTAQLDEKNGIRNIKLLTQRSSIPDLYFVVEDQYYMKVYKRRNENLNIGDVQIKEIRYGFYNDILYSIELGFDKNTYSKLLPIFKQLYGEPNDIGMGLSWNGKKVDLTIYTHPGFDVTAEYKPVTWLQEYNKAKGQKANKYKSDL